jgi:polar amino acid transport system permease protein
MDETSSKVPPHLKTIELEDPLVDSRTRAVPFGFLFTAPWWLIILGGTMAILAFLIAGDEIYSGIFDQLREGVAMTLRVSFLAYSAALAIGLVIGVIRSNIPKPPKPGSSLFTILMSLVRVLLYNIATLYVQILRGLPVLVILLIVAFVLVPIIRDALTAMTGLDLSDWRGSSAESAIVALAFTYGAFLSETFRAGIQSIDKGQIEAARSLGMNYYQTMRFVVLPQAVRRILPPLGNDMVAMIKDSSLVAILGVRDITQIAKTSSGRSFRYPETYMVVALLYLTMTLIGSLIVRGIERRMKQDER